MAHGEHPGAVLPHEGAQGSRLLGRRGHTGTRRAPGAAHAGQEQGRARRDGVLHRPPSAPEERPVAGRLLGARERRRRACRARRRRRRRLAPPRHVGCRHARDADVHQLRRLTPRPRRACRGAAGQPLPRTQGPVRPAPGIG